MNRILSLYYFQPSYNDISNETSDIESWMKGNQRTDKNLITDGNCIAGYEFDVVIYWGSASDCCKAQYMSRCKGFFVHYGILLDYCKIEGLPITVER